MRALVSAVRPTAGQVCVVVAGRIGRLRVNHAKNVGLLNARLVVVSVGVIRGWLRGIIIRGGGSDTAIICFKCFSANDCVFFF